MSPLEQRLNNDPEALELCRWWLAFINARNYHSDNDLGDWFDLLYEGRSGYKDLSAKDIADELYSIKDDYSSLDEMLAKMKLDQGAA